MARVLIIDDEKSFREALAESIRDFGHDVMEATGPQEAFELIRDTDVAFLDLKMPGMSGIDFLREAKPAAPVIIPTAFADSANTIEVSMYSGTRSHIGNGGDALDAWKPQLSKLYRIPENQIGKIVLPSFVAAKWISDNEVLIDLESGFTEEKNFDSFDFAVRALVRGDGKTLKTDFARGTISGAAANVP
jgi:CheY-like chemotaxis protein